MRGGRGGFAGRREDPGDGGAGHGLGGGGVTLDTLLSLGRHAQRSIAIQSPDLVTTELGRAVFRDAVGRGVEVRILTNSLASTDNLEAFSGIGGSCARPVCDSSDSAPMPSSAPRS